MAQIPLPRYLPPLEEWLNGEEFTVSWRSIFNVISSSRNTQEELKSVESFLSDQEVIDILLKPFDANLPPSAQTKVKFETKTSAINVTPSSGTKHDFKKIKEDTFWLSKEANINEFTALRMVMVESQYRNVALLLGPLSEEELANLQEAAGDEKISNTVSPSILLQGLQPVTIQEEFEKIDNRRQRILRTYLSESRYLWKCAEQLLHLLFRSFDREGDYDQSKINSTASWLEERAQALAVSLKSSNIDAIFLRYIGSIRNNAQNLSSGSNFLKEADDREDLEVDWILTQITQATHGMEIMWQILLYTVELPSSQIVLEWFRLLQSCEFFNQFDLDDSYFETLVQPLQALSAVISIALIDNVNSLALLDDWNNHYEVSSEQSADKPFILNPKSITDLHTIILQAADLGSITAGPAILAWTVLLQRTSLRADSDRATLLAENSSSQFSRQGNTDNDLKQAPTPYENVMGSIQASLEEDVIDYFALQAVNVCRVFHTISSLSVHLSNTPDAFFSNLIGSQMRNALLDLIKRSVAVGYITEIIEATILTITGGCGYWDVVNSEAVPRLDDPIVKFLGDTVLVDSFLKIAQSRYPYESLPFLQFVRALASSTSSLGQDRSLSVLNFLEAVPVFTFTLPTDFTDYETIHEEENNNSVRLTKALHLFDPRNKNIGNIEYHRSMSIVQVDPDFVIPVGTTGRIISESGPRVACWFHTYSALKYFGKLLETFLAASDQVDGTTGMSADFESVSEIIEILALLIHSISCSANKNADWTENAFQILEVASSGLNRNRDIITVIFDILEEELQSKSCYLGSDAPLNILISCIHFIHAIIPLAPHRVWPQLARSGIMGATRGGERLSTIVEGVELLSGRFDFLISCSLLFESLLDDLVANALRRKSGRRSTASFTGIQNIDIGSPDQSVANFLQSFTKYLVDVLENSCSWKFQVDEDRRRLCRTIISTFDKVLLYSYGIEFSKDALAGMEKTQNSKIKSQKIALKENQPLLGVLMPSAYHLVESFLSTSSGNLRFQPLLRSYLDGLQNPYSTLFSPQLRWWNESVTASLSFLKTLLRVRLLLNRPASRLEKLLFNSSPLIARLYGSDDNYSNPVISLMESMVIAAANHSPEPPSLLGYLGPQTSRNLMHVLSNLDKPLSRSKTLGYIWHFLGTVVSSRQQWFSNYLLTGKTPREALEGNSTKKETKKIEQTLLTTALKNLINMKNLPISESLAMLEFVALAQNFWPWTLFNESNYLEFIKSISNYVGNLIPPQLWQGNVTESINACNQSNIAAYVAEILAMYLFHSRQIRASIPLEKIFSNLSYYERFGTSAPYYNSSLHALLKQNFEARYSGCSIQDLKRTTLEDQFSHSEYFYDLCLADKMMSHDKVWAGRSGGDGMRAEFERANVNLSLVDAQIAIFQGWKLLSLELSSHISIEPSLQKMFSKLVTDCLLANCKTQPPEEIFCRLSQTRADFALVLTQRLVEVKSPCAESSELLKVVWATISGLRGNFERPVLNADILYYRTLLKLLFLTVRAHSVAKPVGNTDLKKSICLSQLPSIIPIIIEVIKYVVSHGLREIVTSIYESVMDSSPEDLALITGIFQSCLRVPSIAASHSQIVSIMLSDGAPNIALRLFSWSDRLSIDRDPIYGELSILFLLELSSIPTMAEQLALEGVLTQIATANITSYLNNEGVCPLANSPGSRRYYSIWARGILPLLLNVLDSVQKSIAVEVAQFLNFFPILLRQSEEALEAPHMTRLPDQGSKRHITLMACSEVHSLALIIFILNGFRESLKGNVDIPEVNWDSTTVLENVEFWLGSRAILRERLLPMGERELEMVKNKDSGASACELEEKVIAEIMGIRNVLSGSDT